MPSVFNSTNRHDLPHVVGNLFMRGATLAGADLSGATITGDLVLDGSGAKHKSAAWRTKEGNPGKLTLRNTHIGNLMDAEDAWPNQGHLHLDGFSFNHLGGFQGNTVSEMRERRATWWEDWVRRDPDYSPFPYQQLAATFAAAGDRDAPTI